MVEGMTAEELTAQISLTRRVSCACNPREVKDKVSQGETNNLTKANLSRATPTSHVDLIMEGDDTEHPHADRLTH